MRNVGILFVTRVIVISAVKIAYAIKVVKDTQGKGGEVNADMPSQFQISSMRLLSD